MTYPTILILGGYGNTGRPLSNLLLQETDVRLIIAGRSLEKACLAAQELNHLCGKERVLGLALDAADPASLLQGFQNVDLVLVASSTARYAQQVACAALASGCDYLDVQYSTQKVQALKTLAPQIEQAGRCFITDGGFHPGLPAALVRYAAACFDSLEKAVVGSVIREDWAAINLPFDTVVEMVEEFGAYTPFKLQHGQWVQTGFTDMYTMRKMNFGEPFGIQPCAAMFLEELHSLPQQFPTLRDTGFFVGGFNWFVDWLVLPLAIAALKISPARTTLPAARLLKWGLERFSRPPYGTILKLESQGLKDGEPQALDILLSHPDGYLFTAVPVVACLLQYLDGSIRKPGLWTQANLVEPARLLRDLQRLGIEIYMTDFSTSSRDSRKHASRV